MMTAPNKTISSNDPATLRRRQWRMLKDKIARYGMTLGGISVIITIMLIFFYLLYVVLPLLLPASMEEAHQYEVPSQTAGNTLYLAAEEKSEVGVRFTDKAHAVFFYLADGSIISDIALPTPTDAKLTSFNHADSAQQVVAFGFDNGQALVVKHHYDVKFTLNESGDNDRTIHPSIQYPMGEDLIEVDEQGQALTQLAVQMGEEENTLVAITPDHRLIVAGFTKEVDFFDESVTLERDGGELPLPKLEIAYLLLDKEQKVVYLADKAGLSTRVDIRDKTEPQVLQQVQLVENGTQLTSLTFLTGNISLLVGDSRGKITQWFPVRDKNGGESLAKIREFDAQNTPIVDISPEERRKGFLTADSEGQIGIYHSTAHRTLLVEPITNANITHIAVAPRAKRLLAEDDANQFHVWNIENEHPEVSWSALWSKVWYEDHEEPKHMWQSSSASNDFEPKFSLTPLAFGTLKAAFYAMLIAVPLAIFGGIYSAYFMSPAMRGTVKPTIEIMEALPTVILGFLAGLWLAPVVEANLPGIFALLLLLPMGILLTAYGWRFMPKIVKYHISDGWEAALLIPVVIFVAWISFLLSPPLELWFFEGDMPQWLNSVGIDFDQRNALVVGLAMGLAVIPSIFSITEDAVFNVPKHLTSGSLALGATPWQTMTRVVILTASPGIFSAVMIGMGRAVGETMIVLMATGNTAVMDFSIFQGLRTLSANIAVEMPESEVHSTHFRILFLSGLVLFIFTFFLNTIAEVVRHRLRRKYSNL